MGCQKCWPLMTLEEIERRQLECRQQCKDEGGCAKCAENKKSRPTSVDLRRILLSILGKASAFNLLDEKQTTGEDLQAAKETATEIAAEAAKGIHLLNQLGIRL